MVKTAKDIAYHYEGLKIREDRSSNRDKAGHIDRFNKFVGIGVGNPWCAAATCIFFHEADPKTVFPKTGSSQAIKRYLKDKGILFTDPQKLLNINGAVGGWTNVGDSWHGHVFLIVGRLTTKGNLVGLLTIEGNTNGAGSRDGNGLFLMKRMLDKNGQFYPVDSKGKKVGPARTLWFGDTSLIGGGNYW